MKKRTLCAFLLVVVLLMSAAPAAWADETDAAAAGKMLYTPWFTLRLQFPKNFPPLQGSIQMMYSEEVSDGVYRGDMCYSTLSEAEFKNAMGGNYDLFTGSYNAPVCTLYVVETGGLDRLQQVKPNINTSWMQLINTFGDKSLFAGILHYTEEELETESAEGFTKEKKAEYIRLDEAMGEIVDSMTVFEPVEPLKPGDVLHFKTQALDGSEISGEELFTKNRITMINNWTTWCGPCKEELPELERLHQEFQKKGGAVIGVLRDVYTVDSASLAEGKTILEEKGVSYLNLLSCDEFDLLLPLNLYPTTFFVDSEGKLVGEIVEGARVSQYEAVMRSLLGE